MPVVRSSVAESATVTQVFVPLNESALLNFRPVTHVALATVPVLPLPGLVGRGRAAPLVEGPGADEAGGAVFDTVTGTRRGRRRVAGGVAGDRGERVRPVRGREGVPRSE